MSCTKWLLVACGVTAGLCHTSWLVTAKEANRAYKVVQAPVVTLLTEPTNIDSARAQLTRTPDRSPILRSFNPQLKPIDPYAIPVSINRRSALKW